MALNCAANGWLAARDASSRIDVFAASGDAGLPIGAALLAARDMGDPSGGGLDSAYLGPEFSDREIERALVSEPRLRFAHSSAVAEETAELLAAQHVVGWFQGRLEIGPRALGNRSILADPRSVATRDRVNRLKGREPWRPLAPAVHASRATEFFELARSSPFMLFAAAVRPHARERLEGVVHADGTCRPQTVEPAQNARLHELLDRFERRSGLPVLLNTSFNDASEPDRLHTKRCDPHLPQHWPGRSRAGGLHSLEAPMTAQSTGPHRIVVDALAARYGGAAYAARADRTTPGGHRRGRRHRSDTYGVNRGGGPSTTRGCARASSAACRAS